ncbi:putative mitochondrial F1F0-ATP synthase g subunit [Tricharina praecox]|uniref:putative mitochondrial F1F0-ATP synthase g subunit n=1 Tax=Tricharina praecox TaxID=43433 RepID=UPI0022207B23|nr:putative mitochondrial F1F0-ATP synthase g subunit [Tricharina praecox]KAI5850953.1 putative mitochondrial F1F0-ATP synthase g subunit [Tricharina praecox]
MRSSVLRVTRQQLLTSFRRYASTSTSSNAAAQAQAGAAKAQEAATKYAGKAMQVLGKSGESFAKLASKTGGRTGAVLKKIETAIPPTIYYSKVAFEVSKLVFRGQKMTPPDLASFQSSFKSFLNPANLNTFARNAIQSVRSANTKDLAFVGVLGAEILGFFTVGEIIGRRKLIGYRAKVEAHH